MILTLKIFIFFVETCFVQYLFVRNYVRYRYHNRHKLPCGLPLAKRTRMFLISGLLPAWLTFVIFVNVMTFVIGTISIRDYFGLPEQYGLAMYLTPGASFAFGRIVSSGIDKWRQRSVRQQRPLRRDSIIARVWDIYYEGLGIYLSIWEKEVETECFQMGETIATRINEGVLAGREEAFLRDVLRQIQGLHCWHPSDRRVRQRQASADIREGIALARAGHGIGGRLIIGILIINGSKNHMEQLLESYRLI